MLIRNCIVRAIAAAGAATLISFAALSLLVRLPILLMGRAEPWEYRSSNDHFTAIVIELGATFLALAVLLALTRILYKAWSPMPVETFRNH